MPLAPIALAGDKLAMAHRHADFEQPIVSQALRRTRPMLFADP